MKFYYILLLLFLALSKIDELQSLLKEVENMQEQLKNIDQHVKDLQKTPDHILNYMEVAQEIKP